ncbi:Mannitol dehydrogenase, C-terminal domain [Alkaliphilus metalliredigens QYMF]|uniref:Mannitol dehydrogenase, C-terminal domain n=1 Tax=Alkaliphilus metalliredigens (strain QYMF) TaxID=293826 RepID=A6TMT0_ALKMQ|nr:mannitol dehydrogenase family protein [Alkaliphilus metalliredigens]ABR47498.1 Mannitol dehydrogenase, C-terminal domain [Alkaliphilus metalliredigens QYMF]
MLELKVESLKNRGAWEDKGVILPSYDYKKMMEKTIENPTWIHFGAGNIFRGFIAQLQQEILNENLTDRGIIAVETFDYEIIDKIYTPYDNLTMLVRLNADGRMENEVIASIADSIKADMNIELEKKKLKDIFKNVSLQMVSFTITEKGYALQSVNNEFMPVVLQDFEVGPDKPKHAMSILTSLLYERYLVGEAPLAVVSMDNCSHNGEKIQNAVLTIAKEWKERGFVEERFLSYLKDEQKIAYPWSMIDKITPRPSEVVKNNLGEIGIQDMEPVITSKNTFIAPFVNAEIPQYLVIEDAFPNGRPALEEAGVYFTDRETVNKIETMKVTTCLNPLHTALAVYGCILGYTSISAEMKDPQLKLLVEKIGYQEGMPVVVDPKIIKPEDFIKEVIEERLPNPYIPDTPQRIATDTSQKVAIRFGETIKSYVARDDLNAEELTFIPLAIAGWLRYLLGVDDSLKEMQVSADPLLDNLQKVLQGIKVGERKSYRGQVRELLANENIFGLDLIKAGLGNKIEGMFLELIDGEKAVRETLKKYLV